MFSALRGTSTLGPSSSPTGGKVIMPEYVLTLAFGGSDVKAATNLVPLPPVTRFSDRLMLSAWLRFCNTRDARCRIEDVLRSLFVFPSLLLLSSDSSMGFDALFEALTPPGYPRAENRVIRLVAWANVSCRRWAGGGSSSDPRSRIDSGIMTLRGMCGLDRSLRLVSPSMLLVSTYAVPPSVLDASRIKSAGIISRLRTRTMWPARMSFLLTRWKAMSTADPGDMADAGIRRGGEEASSSSSPPPLPPLPPPPYPSSPSKSSKLPGWAVRLTYDRANRTATSCPSLTESSRSPP